MFPKWTPQHLVIWVSNFSTFLMPLWTPVRMIIFSTQSTQTSNLINLQLINNSNIVFFPVLERAPFLCPSLESLQNILVCRFSSILLGPFGGPLESLFRHFCSTSFSDPHLNYLGNPSPFRPIFYTRFCHQHSTHVS